MAESASPLHPPIEHHLVVKAPVVGGQRLSVDEARRQWQDATRLATLAEAIYNRAIERQDAERLDLSRNHADHSHNEED